MNQRRKIRKDVLLLALGIGCSLSVSGQKKKAIDKHTWEQFSPIASFEVSFHSDNFDCIPEEKTHRDELSFERIYELKDSLAATNNYNYLSRIGQLYARLNRKTLAQAYLQKSLDMHMEQLNNFPDSIEAIRDVLMIQMELGNISESINLNKKILEHNPNDTHSVNLMGFLYLYGGDYENAFHYADEACKKYPTDPINYIFKAQALTFQEMTQIQMSENIEKVKKDFAGFTSDFSFLQKTMDKYPNDPKIKITMISMSIFVQFYKTMMPIYFNPLEKKSDFRCTLSKEEEATLVNYENMLLEFMNNKEFKNYFTIYYSMGIIDVLQNQFESAIANFEKAIQNKELKFRDMNDNVSSSYGNITTCHLVLDDKKSAQEWTQKKIDDKASYDPIAQDYVALAQYFLEKKNLTKGQQLIENAIAIDSAVHETYIDLANIMMLQGNLDEAENLLSIAVSLNRGEPALFKSITLFHLYRGDNESAIEYIDSMLQFDPEDTFALDIKKEFLVD